MYLGRMDAIDKSGPAINAVIERNPDAVRIADGARCGAKGGASPRAAARHSRCSSRTTSTPPTRCTRAPARSRSAESIAPRDAFIVARLREAGAIILGKTNLSEWANFRSTHSTSGWSGRGGQTKNPYVLDRNPCGSSSGTGASISANLAAVGIGTETDGSIVCPSSANGLVGIKPTLGLVSRSGIIPISHSQDTAGPMARTVADAATLLCGAERRGPTRFRDGRRARQDGRQRLRTLLNAAALKGARIGVARSFFGFSDAVDRVMDEAIAAMKSAGATIVDPANIATAGKFDDAEGDVLNFEFKADLNAYLAALGPKAPHKTLADLIAFNEKNKDREMPYFGQEQFIKAQAKGPLTSPAYKAARAKCLHDVAHGWHRRDDREVSAVGDHRSDRRAGVADRSARTAITSQAAARRRQQWRATRASRCPRATCTACRSGCRSSARSGATRRSWDSPMRSSRRRRCVDRRSSSPPLGSSDLSVSCRNKLMGTRHPMHHPSRLIRND